MCDFPHLPSSDSAMLEVSKIIDAWRRDITADVRRIGQATSMPTERARLDAIEQVVKAWDGTA